ncbi:MAG: NHL repeat-containing protein, partial [Planctomycetota bacterium]
DEPTHVEVDPIELELGHQGKLETMAMDAEGNLLAGITFEDAPRRLIETNKPQPTTNRGYGEGSNRIPQSPYDSVKRHYAIKVISQQGKTLETWNLDGVVKPKMIHGCEDGTAYVGGEGKLVHLSAKGKPLASIDTDTLYGQKAFTSGITVNDDYVFVAFGMGNSTRATEDIWRLDRDLKNPKQIIKRQYGCCAHIDLDTKDGVLLVAENSRHRVARFDFDGNPLDRWGRRDRNNIEGFAACCNPVNMDFGPNDTLFTAESGIGRIKKFSPTGEFQGLVGYVDTTKFDRGSRLAAASCYIPVEVSDDGSRIFIMDVRKYFIRVLVRKDLAAE